MKEGEQAGEGEKGVVLRTSLAACRYPRVMGLYPGPPEKWRLELGPTRNQTRPEPKFKFSAKRRWSVSNPQLRLRPVNQIPASRTRGLEKRGRIGRVKERKERGKGRKVNKVSYSLSGRGTLASFLHQEETRDKRVPVVATGCDPLAGKLPLSTLSGQHVSLSKEESHQSRHLLQEGEPLPGPETGLLSNTQKWIVQGDTCADKARNFIGKGHPGREQ